MTTQDKASPQGVTLREAQAALEKLLDCTLEEFGESYETVRNYLSQPPAQASGELSREQQEDKRFFDRLKAATPTAEPAAPVAAKPEPCNGLGKGTNWECKDRHQCWEPCGELGHSEEHTRPAPKEAQAAVNKALGLAAKPEQQAQTGGPEVLAWCALNFGGKSIAHFDGKPMVMCGHVGNEHHPAALITLQSHREAIAKRDAALQACVSLGTNFEISGPDDDGLVWLILHGKGTTGRAMFQLGNLSQIAVQTAMHLEQERRAAITQAQEAMK